MSNLLSLAVSVGVPLVAGQISGILSLPDIAGWYTKLRKPKWCPPTFLFGPIWTALYTSAGVASWLVWKQKGKGRVLPMTLYIVQMLLNQAWQPIFFKAHRLDWALGDAAAMLGVAAAATVSMAKTAGPAKILPLMVPYVAFIGFATALTYNIHKNNPQAHKIETTPLHPGNNPPQKKGKGA